MWGVGVCAYVPRGGDVCVWCFMCGVWCMWGVGVCAYVPRGGDVCVWCFMCGVWCMWGVGVCAYVPRSHVIFLWSHSRWLDSSKTLYEQDVKEGDLLYMRFKYYSFMGIDARVRGIWRG